MRVNDIFVSVDGEVNSTGGQGVFATFLRLQGCNLRCSYCDTVYAQEASGGQELAVLEVAELIRRCGPKRITATGGEPLEQIRELNELIEELVPEGFLFSIETNGSHDIRPLLKRDKVKVVMDYKLPSSGMEAGMLKTNFDAMGSADYVKFVVSNLADYVFAKDILANWYHRGRVAFSPVTPGLPAEALMEWLKDDCLWRVQLNIQLHKVIGVK
jgi:7-carboxy-7-deazaguanine synthase